MSDDLDLELVEQGAWDDGYEAGKAWAEGEARDRIEELEREVADLQRQWVSAQERYRAGWLAGNRHARNYGEFV